MEQRDFDFAFDYSRRLKQGGRHLRKAENIL